MHDIHIGVVDQIHKVVVAGYLSESCLLCHVLAPSQAGLIYVAYSNQAVWHLEVMATAAPLRNCLLVVIVILLFLTDIQQFN